MTQQDDLTEILIRIQRLVDARRVTGSWTEEELNEYRLRLEATYLPKGEQS